MKRLFCTHISHHSSMFNIQSSNAHISYEKKRKKIADCFKLASNSKLYMVFEAEAFYWNFVSDLENTKIDAIRNYYIF